jgi:hypothetical protein
MRFGEGNLALVRTVHNPGLTAPGCAAEIDGMKKRIYGVTEAQLSGISNLYRLVARISDGLGSEASDNGQVLTCAENTFAAARRVYFPTGYRFVAQTAALFTKEFGKVDGVADLLAFCAPLKPQFGLTGAREWFDPTAADRGSFWICIFLSSRQALGRTVLVRFNRAET